MISEKVLNVSVMAPQYRLGMNISKFNTGRYQVERKDNTITVASPPNGRRSPANTHVTVSLGEDTIELRGRKDRKPFNWDISLSPDGATISSTRKRPTRRGMAPTASPALSRVSLPEGVQLQGEALQRFGLEVAGSVVGVPLGLLA